MSEEITSLKNALDLKKELQEVDNKVLNIIYSILFDVQEICDEYKNIDELKEQFIIWENLLENEFTINYKFGNINMNLLNKIDERFKKEGFNLYCISDCDTRSNQEGLIFYFKNMVVGVWK